MAKTDDAAFRLPGWRREVGAGRGAATVGAHAAQRWPGDDFPLSRPPLALGGGGAGRHHRRLPLHAAWITGSAPLPRSLRSAGAAGARGSSPGDRRTSLGPGGVGMRARSAGPVLAEGLEPPGRPEGLHLQPPTDSGREPLDSSGSCKPPRALTQSRSPGAETSGSSLSVGQGSWGSPVPFAPCALRAHPRYYETVRPLSVHRYFPLSRATLIGFSLGITDRVLTFSRSVPEPGPSSCPLYAACREGHK